jgi:hypothetical protein
LGKYDFKRFIELGTALGNTSVYFKLFCINRKANFITYDFGRKNQLEKTPVQEFVDLKSDYRRLDIIEKSEAIKKIIKRKGRSIVFCDAGDKPHELRTFAPALKNGDIIACHDWGRAIKDEWVADDIKKNNLIEIYQKERLELNTVTGIFIKREK